MRRRALWFCMWLLLVRLGLRPGFRSLRLRPGLWFWPCLCLRCRPHRLGTWLRHLMRLALNLGVLLPWVPL